MTLIQDEGRLLQHQMVVEEAIRRGITVTDVSDVIEFPAVLLESPKGQRELVVQGGPSSWTHMQTRCLCDYKHLTKIVFQRVGINAPKNILFNNPTDTNIKDFFEPGQSYVCKPNIGDGGIGVELGIRSLEEIQSYWERNKQLCTAFLLEEQVTTGSDLRIQVIGGKIAAACIREPACVIGNGKNSLIELIDARRMIMKTQNPANHLELDKVSMKLIEQQRLHLASIPIDGQKVVLKTVSNIGQGGIPIDVTDKLHPTYHQWVKKVEAFLKTAYFALDFISPDPAENPIKTSYCIEINPQPTWLHHTFSERKTHNLAAVVLDCLFG